MQILKLQFHTSSNLLARFPALQTRISRSAHEKNLKRIQRLKKKLGDDYRLIGRDKRQSPLTQVRSPSKPSQPPKPIPTKLIIEPLLLKPNYEPLPIIPSNWKDSIKNQLKAQETENLKVGKGLRELVPQQVQKQVELTKLELSPKVVPELLMNGDRPGQTLSGPYYNYGILPNECEKIFQSSSTDLFKQEYSQEQLELARRILSTNNSNAQQIRKFNTKRMVELFQRYPGDCGSSEVQGHHS